MPFEILETQGRQIRGTKISISYKRWGAKSGKAREGSRPRLMISLTVEVAKLLGIKKQSEPWAILIGSGDMAGTARFLPHPKGTGLGVLIGRCPSLRFGFVPMLGTNAAALEYIDYRIVDHPNGKTTVKALEIVLPAWFKAD